MNGRRENMQSVYKNHLIMIINIAYPNNLVQKRNQFWQGHLVPKMKAND